MLKPVLSVSLKVASPLWADPVPAPTISKRPREIVAKSFHTAASLVIDTHQFMYHSAVLPEVTKVTQS
jgi:hypothetical protein